VLALQLFLVGLSVPVLLLGSVIDQLRRAEAHTREFARAVVKLHDDERRTVARELHESAAQDLVAATLAIPSVRAKLPAEAAPFADKLAAMLEQSIVKLRRISQVLHPPLLEESGLPLALKAYANGLAKRTGMHVTVDLDEMGTRLPNHTELVLFRVAQEALESVRHDASTNAHIRLHQTQTSIGDRVVLTVSQERDVAAASTDRRRRSSGQVDGLRLTAIRERLRLIGGTLHVTSRNGRFVLCAISPIPARQNP
jgi:signal transduction histidine kinase